MVENKFLKILFCICKPLSLVSTQQYFWSSNKVLDPFLTWSNKRLSVSKYFLFRKLEERVPQSETIVIKLSNGRLWDCSFYRVPLESEEGRIPQTCRLSVVTEICG